MLNVLCDTRKIMSSEKRMIAKFKRKFPIASLIEYRNVDFTKINSGQSSVTKVIGIVVALNEETLGVTILSSNTLIRRNLLNVLTCAKTLQRPYEKQLSAR